MIRKMLKLSRKELGTLCRIPTHVAYEIDVGKDYPSPIIAKQIQEVARRNGLAVTLDELYQNLVIDFDKMLNPSSSPPQNPTDSSHV